MSLKYERGLTGRDRAPQPRRESASGTCAFGDSSSSPLLLSSLELSDTTIYEPYIRALLGSASGTYAFGDEVSGVGNLRTTTSQKCEAVLRRARI